MVLIVSISKVHVRIVHNGMVLLVDLMVFVSKGIIRVLMGIVWHYLSNVFLPPHGLGKGALRRLIAALKVPITVGLPVSTMCLVRMVMCGIIVCLCVLVQLGSSQTVTDVFRVQVGRNGLLELGADVLRVTLTWVQNVPSLTVPDAYPSLMQSGITGNVHARKVILKLDYNAYAMEW
jgi:hypothetical protein